MPVDHERIRRNGWRQGRAFSEEDTAAMLDHPTDNARLILVSHDCDIVHSGEDEPLVEVCVAEPLPGGLNGTYRWARHPRRIDLEIQIDGESAGFCVKASHRQFIARTVLEQLNPDDRAELPERELTQLTLWLGSRYTRVALPDAFNERRRPSQSRVKRILRRSSKNISGIMLAMMPRGEADDDEDYQVRMVALMPRDDFLDDARRGEVDDAIQEIADAFQGCDGIEVLDSDVKSEEDFSFHDAHYFFKLNFDDLSLREDPEHPMIPN